MPKEIYTSRQRLSNTIYKWDLVQWLSWIFKPKDMKKKERQMHILWYLRWAAWRAFASALLATKWKQRDLCRPKETYMCRTRLSNEICKRNVRIMIPEMSCLTRANKCFAAYCTEQSTTNMSKQNLCMPAKSCICQTLLIYEGLFGHLCRILHRATNDKYVKRDIHMTDETKRDLLMTYVQKNLILHWANTENMSKETCICEKRHSYDRRDQTRSTHNICRKRPHTAQSKHQKYVKRDL